MANFPSDSVKRLYHAVASLETEEQCARFLEDLCTIKEVQDMAQRLDTAILLDKGMNYQTISREVGISTATISRVSRCLNYGQGGYREVLELLKKSVAAEEKS
ncbi:MAG: TrpR-related protein YerC/YecD [Clostridia bacterium]|nr:TrpR-related protein YerC/YecD [Clostridia bacterium]